MRVLLCPASGPGRGFHPRQCKTANWVEIGFNSKYVLDALNAADTDQVRIELSGPVSPVKVLPMTDDSFLFLVLPMRLKNEA